MSTPHKPTRIPIQFRAEYGELSVLVMRQMASARQAQISWANTPVVERLKLLRKLRGLIADHALELAQASAYARQLPVSEMLTAEVLPLAEACRFLEREAVALLASKHLGQGRLPLWLSGVSREIQREPFGIILIIGPGNYPLLLPGVQTIQALIAGNAVLLKPGGGGSAVARKLQELLVQAGFDHLLITILPESTKAAQAAIEAGPDKVLFTGSASTGEKILTQLSPHLIPSTMELSGADPVIVRADADLDLVAKAIYFGLTLNGGATCMAPKRLFVHRSVASELEGRLQRTFAAASPRRFPQNLSAHLRPMIEESLLAGAHFIAGTLDSDGNLIGPAVLAGVPADYRILDEEVFGPLLVMVTVGSDDEAIETANDSSFALGASIFTKDESEAQNLSGQIHAGVVSINDLIIPTADAYLPFGGSKRSGFGKTRGAEGLLELTKTKVVTTSRSKFRPAFETPEPRDAEMFKAYLQVTHGFQWRKRISAVGALIKTLLRKKNNHK